MSTQKNTNPLLFLFAILFLLLIIGGVVYYFRQSDFSLARLLHPSKVNQVQDNKPQVTTSKHAIKRKIPEPAIFAHIRKPESKTMRSQLFLNSGSGVESSANEKEIIDSLGQPDSISSKKTPNIHNPEQLDTLRSMHYQGMLVSIYHVNSTEQKDIVTLVRVTFSARALLWGLRVGCSRQQVLDLLGSPAEEGSGEMVYSDEEGYASTIFTLADDGKVTDVRWEYYID